MTIEARHPAGLEDDALLDQCKIRRGRRSGPGGQHRNKVETAVVIRHVSTGVTAEATERRSQEQNRVVAVFRLRVNLALAERRATDDQPSPLWKTRCTSGRISISRRHADFPTLLAEVLDAVTRQNGDTRATAQWLNCTHTQLTRFLRLEPRALQMVNDLRRQADLRPLV